VAPSAHHHDCGSCEYEEAAFHHQILQHQIWQVLVAESPQQLRDVERLTLLAAQTAQHPDIPFSLAENTLSYP